jgi:hypothetical protein
MKQFHLESGSPKTKLKIMNSKPKKRLSFNELKSSPRFENYTDETAEETIASLETLSILFYEYYQKTIKEKKEIKLFSVKEAM